MKQKFKNYDNVKNFNHKKYRQLLTAYLKKNVGQIANFILEKEAEFDEAKPMPFVYVGDLTNDWKEFKKKNKTKNTFAAGRCFIEPLGEGFIIKMLAEIGKGAKDKTVKEVNKIFKKEDLYIEFVSELPNPKEQAVPSSEAKKTPLDKIEDALEEHIAAYGQYQKDPSKIEEKNRVLKRLKRLCQQWRHVHETGVPPSSRYNRIKKDIEKFEAFFAKRKAAKEGQSNDPEALAVREEKMYAKTLKFRKEFYDSLSKGQIRDIAVIENQLEDMKTQLGEWNKFTKQNKQATYKDALQQLIEDYKTAQKSFNKIKKNLEHFFEAIEDKDTERAIELAKVIRNKI
ncbi:MAG: hypothetical protein ACRBFS_22815 [Aureispira sp.]